ncbi:hypothetical protein RCC89_00315 [Cytophagaceae bacterium ABcell3]|nr:hypothetical protein RCC89_00315 [Cytophagaceae bacterium ABcell3]
MASKQSPEGKSTIKDIMEKVSETTSQMTAKASGMAERVKEKVNGTKPNEQRDISGREKPANKAASSPEVSAQVKSGSEGKIPVERAEVSSLSDKVVTTKIGEPESEGGSRDNSARPQREPIKGGRHSESKAQVQKEPLKKSHNPKPSGGKS